ncbi:MAG: ACP phosphodiesterase [Capnocytophaga sp.]|nr:ACP phosphodiesterase [Capnocytophaga sp.]
MNFLAHIYLSGEDDNYLKIGNFIADTIRGKQYESYPKNIQKGILLHRKMDTFTDTHPIFRQSKKRLVPDFGHYAGVITDIFYDYFLAKNWNIFSKISLENYAQNFYYLIDSEKDIFNEDAKKLIFYMIKDNWLVSYKSKKGIQKILYQMDARTNFQSKMQFSITQLENYESFFEEEFFTFFSEIQNFVKTQISDL